MDKLNGIGYMLTDTKVCIYKDATIDVSLATCVTKWVKDHNQIRHIFIFNKNIQLLSGLEQANKALVII